MPEDQKGDVVAPATDKKETEEEDMDAPWMRFLIETTKTSSRRRRFRFCAEASGFLNPNVESSAKTLASAQEMEVWDVGSYGPEGSIGDIK